jgi:hypothetical protein
VSHDEDVRGGELIGGRRDQAGEVIPRLDGGQRGKGADA